jgi:hypothetical protein
MIANEMKPDFDTNIKGAFRGWKRGTRFELTNGQIWEQTETKYQYQYLYRPEAVVYEGSSGYEIRVEDMDETVTVKRIR